MRIACLVPSATDLVASLGFSSSICGISHECDHPEVRGARVVTSPRVASAPTTAPGEVDAQVRAALGAKDSLYVADQAGLRELGPDWVIGQSVCDVCAVTPDEARRALPPGSQLLTMCGTSVAGLHADLRALGQAVGASARAEAVIADIESSLAALPTPALGATMVALEWSDPPFLGGHWVPELIERAGGQHLLSKPGAPSVTASYNADQLGGLGQPFTSVIIANSPVEEDPLRWRSNEVCEDRVRDALVGVDRAGAELGS